MKRNHCIESRWKIKTIYVAWTASSSSLEKKRKMPINGELLRLIKFNAAARFRNREAQEDTFMKFQHFTILLLKIISIKMSTMGYTLLEMAGIITRPFKSWIRGAISMLHIDIRTSYDNPSFWWPKSWLNKFPIPDIMNYEYNKLATPIH